MMKGFPKRFKHVISKEIGRKGMLLDLETGTYFEVDPVGLAIWKECDGKNSLEAISKKISRKYSATPDKIQKDVAAYLEKLRNSCLLHGGAVKNRRQSFRR